MNVQDIERLRAINAEVENELRYLGQNVDTVGRVVPTQPPGQLATTTDSGWTRRAITLALISGTAGAGAVALSNTVSAPKPISMEEVYAAQDAWAKAIVSISKSYLDHKDYVAVAGRAADELYGYGRSNVLFKPTKAAENPFRPTGEEALSYFVGAEPLAGKGYNEDHGFAINGGKGWKTVLFDNHNVELTGDTAVAMGHYYFIAFDGSVSKVEYTFGYMRNDDGKIRIYLHHSSVPYDGSTVGVAGPKPIDMEEITAAQDAWGKAIVRISDAYLKKGDYVGAATDAAGELYGYGRSNVLFKPTKAAENPFRPTGEEALSYFIGGEPLNGKGYDEDHGFAINGGKGWKKVMFDNNQVDLNGPTAIAMGHYYFTAFDNSIAKVEYTFGYKRNDDGKVRIFLHHSSLPYGGNAQWVQPEAAPQ